MTTFDFRKYHVKAMNASTEEEKTKINQELKDIYASLSEDEKVRFNQELQQFLVKEYSAINSMYNGINN